LTEIYLLNIDGHLGWRWDYHTVKPVLCDLPREQWNMVI